MPIRVGDIVTVVLECLFTELQGIVVAIVDDGDEDGSIEVQFGKEYKDSGHYWSENTLRVRFEEEDLRVDSCWSATTLAERLFKGRWHHVYEAPYPFTVGCDCQILACPEKAISRGICNVWGSIVTLDLCEGCTKLYHGMCGDSVPNIKSVIREAISV